MNIEALKKYLKPGISMLCVGLVILAGCAAYGVLSVAKTGAWIPLAIGLLFAVLITWFGVKEQLDFRRFLGELEQRSDLRDLMNDFESARSWFKDDIRTGEAHLYVKNAACLYEYGDIRNLHQYVHKTNGVEDRRELRAVMADAKSVTLCRLKTRGRSNDDMVQLTAAIVAKNPAITLGYKK